MGKIEEELAAHQQCYFQTVGDSMEPILHNRKSTVVIQKAEEDLKPLDVALFFRPSTGTYVLHRVVKVKETYYRICGDNRTYEEKVPKEWILGYMTGFFPDESETFIDCKDKTYQEYVEKWVKRHRIEMLKSLPIRSMRKVKQKVKNIFLKNQKKV